MPGVAVELVAFVFCIELRPSGVNTDNGLLAPDSASARDRTERELLGKALRSPPRLSVDDALVDKLDTSRSGKVTELSRDFEWM